ncbi:hypothetical protein [Flavobacterium sp. UBA6195]|nr:hypothetical protein [Flavobacterium sp. UBA6195]
MIPIMGFNRFNINKIDDKIISIEMGFNPFGIMDKNNDSNNGF